jgi:diaminohydroxyphosphoribosylaminopyrimidine deaminase/5-amino-6-(5-phosphoribosylamino)uracil reductase
MSFTPADKHFMKLALRLAARGAGFVSPNPMVGAVVVQHPEVAHHGHLVGRGWHRRYGGPHAEVEALHQAGEKARGATLYVTLEPCNHHGLTPPCTEAVLAAGLIRVVIATRDPNPKVSGGGIEYLKQKGVQVETGLLADEARRLNEAWFKWVETGFPLVIAKAACSLDGRVATVAGESQWITGEASRAFGHKLRHACDAILVGLGTVLADDPQLTCRLPARGKKLSGGKGQGSQTPALSPKPPLPTPYESSTGILPVKNVEQPPPAALSENRKPETRNRTSDPIRIVLDSRLRIPLTARVLHLDSPAPTWIATTKAAPLDKVRAVSDLGAEVLLLPEENGRVALRPLLQLLGERRVQSALVEGGPEVLGAFFDQRLVDKFYFFYAPKVLGGQGAYPAVAGKGVTRLNDVIVARDLTIRRLGPDFLVSGYL